ncbi:MAG TPA: hypothetical protein PK760_03665 [Flavobacteriales bacterium]|nr:hypothetical protein [Flavobacteriales bacterium]
MLITELIDPQDLEMLIHATKEELLGRIVLLNKSHRYTNRLNAIELAAQVEEIKRQNHLRARR